MTSPRSYIPGAGAWLAIAIQAMVVLGACGFSGYDLQQYPFPWALGGLAAGCFLLSLLVCFVPAFLVIRRTDSYALRVATLLLGIPGFFIAPALICDLAGAGEAVYLARFRHDCVDPGVPARCEEIQRWHGGERVPAGLDAAEARAARLTRWRAKSPAEANELRRKDFERASMAFGAAFTAGRYGEASQLGWYLRGFNVYTESDLGVRIEIARLHSQSAARAEREKGCEAAKAALPRFRESLHRDLASVSAEKAAPATFLPALMQLYLCEPESELVAEGLRAAGVRPLR